MKLILVIRFHHKRNTYLWEKKIFKNKIYYLDRDFIYIKLHVRQIPSGQLYWPPHSIFM